MPIDDNAERKIEVPAISFVLLQGGDSGEILITVRDLGGLGLSDFNGKHWRRKQLTIGLSDAANA